MKRLVNFFLVGILLCVLCGCATSEQGRSARHHPRRDFTRPRPGQERWIAFEEAAPVLKDFVERYKMSTQRRQVTNELTSYLRLTYGRVSINGEDVEGGTRALDFLGELLQALRGERALWQDAVQAAKHPDAKSVGLAAEPIPSGYIARWY